MSNVLVFIEQRDGKIRKASFEALTLGADGWVAGLVVAFPKETVAIYQLVKAGRLAEALAIYRWFMPLLHLDVGDRFVHQIKLAMQEAGVGSEVVLWGQSPSTGAVLSIDEVAAAAGTTGYELMCAVAPRVPVVSDEEAVRK